MSGYVPNIPRAKREAELKEVEPTDVHAERWAEYERHARQPAKPDEKIKLALRIGVFFDGTGNNATNSALGLACGAQHPIEPKDLDASCKPYMADPDSSYGNDATNVRKLMELYTDSAKPEGEGLHKRLSRKIYVEGIGTEAGKEDSLLGSGMGRGETGVSGCVQRAFTRIATTVTLAVQENPGCTISALTIDTFGFSRGAAAARHFANEVVKGLAGPLGPTLQNNANAFSSDFIGRYGQGINVAFIGLFDTVASVGGLSNLGNIRSGVTPSINLYLPRKYFPNVIHLVARDEIRGNFPLTRVKPEHAEISLPGAHSDIGGGYLNEAEECVLVSPMQALTVNLGIDVTATSIYKNAEQAKQRLVAEGWPATMLEVVTPSPKLLPTDPHDRLAPRLQRVYAGLQLRRSVNGSLSRVYLRVMCELAKRTGVRFDEIDEHNPNYSLPDDLKPLCTRFLTGDYSTTPNEEKLLRERYVHVSANWNNPLGKRTPSDFKLIYINAPEANGLRRQHPHVPNWTLF
ncbi:phospholipase effector Tle1 domain-containing protein [Stutzerimonas zhaodongensis]|uniref:phospholipase effector Tle1 domain-containing protein n=1 Tax=Stutzerimonas TaxID=2901164 RepID=UPI003890E3B0